jgi:hypothetical protein
VEDFHREAIGKLENFEISMAAKHDELLSDKKFMLSGQGALRFVLTAYCFLPSAAVL